MIQEDMFTGGIMKSKKSQGWSTVYFIMALVSFLLASAMFRTAATMHAVHEQLLALWGMGGCFALMGAVCYWGYRRTRPA